MSFVLYLTNNIGPTGVGVNTFSTIVLFTLTTNYDGGTLLTTQHKHFCLILRHILRGGRVAFVSPNMRRDMLPWSIGGMTHLPANAKSRKMQQIRNDWCNSLGPPRRMFLTKPQCHRRAKGCSMRACLVCSLPCFCTNTKFQRNLRPFAVLRPIKSLNVSFRALVLRALTATAKNNAKVPYTPPLQSPNGGYIQSIDADH